MLPAVAERSSATFGTSPILAQRQIMVYFAHKPKILEGGQHRQDSDPKPMLGTDGFFFPCALWISVHILISRKW
jgi:hypothetical protein